jgi:alpha-L-fucosidase
VFSLSAVRSTQELTLDDLRKLEIICFVPSHLPKDFRLQRVDITYDELHEEFDDMKHQLPLYSIVYSNDSESPVVTEINLDGVDKNGNEFNQDGLTQEGEWVRCPVPDTSAFMRYRALESKGNHYKIEYQENGGGTLTTASIIEFDVNKRNIQRDGKPVMLRVLRVTSYNQK